jgi:hypothetical protein
MGVILMRRLVAFFGLIEKLCWSGLLNQLTELRNTSLLSCWSNQPLVTNWDVPITTIRDVFLGVEGAEGVDFGLGDVVGDAVGDVSGVGVGDAVGVGELSGDAVGDATGVGEVVGNAGGVASCETITE